MRRVHPRWSPWVALLPPFVALAVQLALWPLISPLAWFLFFPAVFLSSWIGGWRPGLAATAVSAGLVWYFFLEPRYAFAKGPKVLFALAVFVGMGVLFSAFHERLRHATLRAAVALDEAGAANASLREANDRVSSLLEKTQELDRLKSEFIANVSHELRTPLTMILGPLVELLRSPNVVQGDKDALEVAERNARLLLRLVNELLEASTLESGRARLDCSDADLAELVLVVAGQFAGIAQERGITLDIKAAEPVYVQLDVDRVQRAVLNLLANALKLTPSGGRVRVEVSREGALAQVVVADSGPGIPPEARELVFERFRQVEGDAARRFGGAGLGLAIVRDIADLHSGRVTAEQAPEGGALLRLVLPLVQQSDTAQSRAVVVPPEDVAAILDDLAPAAAPRPSSPYPADDAEVGSVLVIDDNADVNQYLCRGLASAHRVAGALDGPSGLALAKELRPTVIVCDVMMPGMSGEEVLARLRQDPELHGIPVLVLTAKLDPELRVRLLRAGANDFVVKPFSLEEVQVRVGNLARLRLLELADARARARAEGLLEAAPDATVVVDGAGRIVMMNTQVEKTFGYTQGELRGQPVELLLPESARAAHPQLRGGFARRPRRRRMGSGLDLHARRKDGSLFPVDVSLSPVETPDGMHYIAAVRDVTSQRDVQERLRHLALHDALTGLPNRVLLLDRLGQALGGLSRQPGHVAVLFVDVDRFKSVNDQWGHEVGDQVLAEVSRRMLATVRPQDTVARLGGDEFAIACGGLADELEAVLLAERVEEALREPVDAGHARVHPTVSIGLAVTPDAGADPEGLLRDADTAMYAAKHHGRGRVEVFDDALGQLARTYFEAEAMLRDAIASGYLRLLYQPVLDLATLSLMGVEALVRIADPVRGLLEPEAFIETAEDSGLIIPLGDWVMRAACAQLAAWQRGGHRLTMAVNLSGRQISQLDLRELVLGATDATGADPTLLHLEVTETALMHASVDVVEGFAALKRAGVHLAIDDFGTGWSSLTYLKSLPVDVIKIDRTFTEGLGVLNDDTAIVRSLVGLGHALGCQVVIEGLETEDQLQHAQALDCDLGQGYLLGRPVPPEEVIALLDHAVALLPVPRVTPEGSAPLSRP